MRLAGGREDARLLDKNPLLLYHFCKEPPHSSCSFLSYATPDNVVREWISVMDIKLIGP